MAIGAKDLMLCTLVAEPFDDPDWLFESKFDGLRILCHCDRKQISLVSRNDKPQTFQFPDIVDGLELRQKNPACSTEKSSVSTNAGRRAFARSSSDFISRTKQSCAIARKKYPAYLYVFDLLELNGKDLRRLRLSGRKEKLRPGSKWSDRIRWTDGVVCKGTKLFNKICKQAGEGIIAKRFDSIYIAGRSSDWVKIKCSLRQEFVIGGFTEPQRNWRVGLGASLVGYWSDDGKRLHYAGKVGTGFNNQTLMDLRRRLAKIETKRRRSTRASRHAARSCIGSSRSWSGRSPSRSGHRTECYASRALRAFAPTRNPDKSAASGRR